MTTPTQASKHRRTRQFLLGGAAAIALLAGAASLNHAFAQPHSGGWSMEQGVPVDRIEHRADHMLKQVNATPDQQAKIHTIIEAAAKDIDPIRKSMSGTRAQMRSLLSAPQIDRAAIETLRAQRIAGMDQISQRMTKSLADAADVLTPDQRLKLAAIEAKHEADHAAKHGMHDKN